MASMFDNFKDTMFRFNKRKENYPAPWDTAPDSVFNENRQIIPRGGATFSQKISANVVRAVNGMLQGEHAFGVDIDNHMVMIEYYSSADRVFWMQYNYETGTFKAAELSGKKDSREKLYTVDSTAPLGAISSLGFSGVAAMQAFILGEVVAFNEGMYASLSGASFQHASQIGEALNILVTPTSDITKQLDDEPRWAMGNLAESVYFRWRERSRTLSKGTTISPDGYFEHAVLDDIAEASSSAVNLNDYLSKSSAYGISINMMTEPLLFDFNDVETPAASKRKKSTDTLDSLRAECKLDIHPLTAAERDMVPHLDDHYVVDSVLANAARKIHRDWKIPGLGLAPNFILEGDAGSGKTAASRFWADIFGVPRTKMTMNPLFESANLIGAFYPVFNDVSDWKCGDEDKKALGAIKDAIEKVEVKCEDAAPKTADVILSLRRAFSSESVRAIIRESYSIPSAEEIEYDPDEAWKMLGMAGEAPDPVEITMAANSAFENKAYRLLNILTEQAESGGVNYRFILSELMKAFKHGWLLEIQEAASVLRPGVLTELNSLLEPNGRIELPNGEHITRHPDTIVVITTNRDYGGNVDLNESLRDRCMFGLKMDLPPAEVMADRACAQIGFEDKALALAAAQTVYTICEEAKSKNIRGSFGMRSLLGWLLDIKAGDKSEESFKQRIIYKMTTRDDDVQILMDCFRAHSPFAKKTTKKR